jgi:hypothetical protein
MYRRLTALMALAGFEAIRIKKCGVDGGGVTDRVRGYRKKTDRQPYPVSNEHPGKVDTSSDYVMSHVVARLEQRDRGDATNLAGAR